MFKRIWQPEMIVEHIQSRHGRERLNSHYYATTYPDVYAAAERLFGSWKVAIEAAGLDYSKICRYKKWSREKVIRQIKEAHVKGRLINSNAKQKNNKPLYMAAVKRFGNWENAVKAAGIDYDEIRIRRSMTKNEIKREIMQLYRSGVSLSYTNMRENYQYLMAAGMKKIGGGSWAVARLECGILTNFRRLSTKRREQSNSDRYDQQLTQLKIADIEAYNIDFFNNYRLHQEFGMLAPYNA